MATETEPAAAPRLLLGPPLIRAARPSPDSAAATSDASHPFLDLLDAAFNAPSPAAIKAALKPRRALTENCSATYANSGNPCLDFFFQVVPDTALRLACNLRGVRGTGKSDREGFYAAALWMHEHHPRTLACNVAALAEFGYLKDFPELLFRLLRGPDVLELPEVYMSAQRWSELPYTRVASVAMRRYKSLFKKHDEERFDKYLEDVEAGKAKIAAGALLPHEIAAAAYRGQDDNVSELQWRRMVDDLRSKGSLRNCISVCDVSLSMSGTPMEVCIALGVLTSELSEEPWAGKVITFSENPEIHLIKGKTLRQKMDFVRRMHWAGSTNFQGVFDQILRTAVEASLAPEKMIRTVFVYSDMEFNMASGSAYAAYYSRRESVPWETDYEVICKKFRDAGYGDVVPQIIFWNLRDSKSTPVTSTQPGVAMVSGFSKNFLKIFLKNDGVVNPEAIMMEAIAGEEYQKLVVYD
uniref:TROVE domain-containing protein n=1 Tax=Aegilops tauschii subsp. strangulata TaxID=200361 RepID=A0A452ZN20_AEGTS